MSKFIVKNSGNLNGTIKTEGAKNSALPIISASLLTSEKCTLENIPFVSDISLMCEILYELGVNLSKISQNCVEINASKLKSVKPSYDLVSGLRASFLVMGSLLAREGKAVISLPGGCRIGTRPVDLHLKGLREMGAEITQSHGIITARAQRLCGAEIYLDYPSVGATENILMAATLAQGTTIINNAATEPEISDLASFLRKMGAKIKGDGTERITICGVDNLHGASYSIMPDRIEAGTYLVAAAATGGSVTIKNCKPAHIKPITAKLGEMGAIITEGNNFVRIDSDKRLKSADISTLPYPGFPTDMQAQFSALLSIADGTSIVKETVFENRFMYASALKRMGANIKTEGRSAIIEGEKQLTGAPVEATDLRAGAALVIAALSAKGSSEISEIEHIDRGYFHMDEKLNSLGAHIIREP